MIPPSTAWQPSPISTGERSDAGSSQEGGFGASFGDLLAAMLAARAPAGEFLKPAPDVPHDPGARKRPAAEMFNEHGFMDGPVRTGVGPVDKSERSSSHRASVGQAAAAATSAPAHDATPAAVGAAAEPWTASMPPASRVAQAAVAIHSASVAAREGAASFRTWTPVVEAAQPKVADADPHVDEVQAETPERLLEDVEEYLRGGSAVDAQLSLEAGEEGLRLLARVGRLGREDRERLRGDIARLLTSHGYAAAEIRLNGDRGSPRRA